MPVNSHKLFAEHFLRVDIMLSSRNRALRNTEFSFLNPLLLLHVLDFSLTSLDNSLHHFFSSFIAIHNYFLHRKKLFCLHMIKI